MNKRSITAVLAGLVFTIVVTTIVDYLLHAIGVYPPAPQPLTDQLALVATCYRILVAIGGAYLTARLAPFRPMQHALALGVVGTLLGMLGVAATWNAGLGPRWYPVALALLAIPQCWAGGKLYERRTSER